MVGVHGSQVVGLLLLSGSDFCLGTKVLGQCREHRMSSSGGMPLTTPIVEYPEKSQVRVQQETHEQVDSSYIAGWVGNVHT